MLNRFVGVDLAWAVDRRHTAVALMEGNQRSVGLTDLSSDLCSLESVTEFVRERLASDTVVAIDASLIVANETGQRPCETEIGRAFGQFGASCHSTNRTRPHWDTGKRLARNFAKLGFRHGLPLHRLRGRGGRWLIEVYPHPAMVRLFALDRIIAYKKGPVGARRAGLRLLHEYLHRLATDSHGLRPTPCLHSLLAVDPQTRRGAALKRHEDDLDAVFCAYLAWYAWRWGGEHNEVFGDVKTGYIVVPQPTV